MKVNTRFLDKNSLFYTQPFRPFFLFTACYSLVFIGSWTLIMMGEIAPFPRGDIVAWHIHEMIFGVFLSSLGGFILTAFPAWTNSKKTDGPKIFLLVVLWLLARVAMWSTSYVGITPTIIFNVSFLFLVIFFITPPVLKKKNSKQRIFYFELLLLFSTQLATYYAWYNDEWLDVRAFLHLSIGVYILIVITALSRISMVVVNHALDKYGVSPVRYLARPPRRNFALAMVSCYFFVSYLGFSTSVSGWLALASAAAVLNILNDWHLPKIWRDSYVQALYCVYIFIVLGFVLSGVNLLVGVLPNNVSIHSLTIGGLGLSVITVLVVASQRHTGQALSYSWPVRLMMFSMILASVFRLAPIFITFPNTLSLKLSALCWCLSFGLYLLIFSKCLLYKFQK